MRYRLTKSSMKLPKFNNTEYTATVKRDSSFLTNLQNQPLFLVLCWDQMNILYLEIVLFHPL